MDNNLLDMSHLPIYAAMTSRRQVPNEMLPSLSSPSGLSVCCPNVHKELDLRGLRLGFNRLVEWKNDEPQLPRNWSSSKKAYNDILVCFFEFWMSAISSSGVCFSMKLWWQRMSV